MAKLGASEEAFKARIAEVAASARSPEQIELLTVEAGAAKAAEAAEREAAERVPAGPLGLAIEPDRRPDDGEEGAAGDPAAAEPAKRRGRPPGARNKSTGVTRAYILSQFGDPLTMLARRGMMDPVELAAKLGCKPIEAFNAQNTALAKCLPFVHSPQPAAVKVEGQGALAMFWSGVPVDGSGDEVVDGSDWQAIEAMAARIGQDRVENQGVSITDVEPSNVEFSNAKPENQEKSDG